MPQTPGVLAVDHDHHTVTVAPYPLLRLDVRRYYGISRATEAELTNEAIVGLAIGMQLLEARNSLERE